MGTSEEDKQLLTEQLINAQEMAKILMTENLSLNCDTLPRPCKNTNKQNEELKIAVKRLQQEQFSYSNLIKMPNTFKYLCELSVEQFNISWNCVQPYYDVLISPDALMSKVLGRDF